MKMTIADFDRYLKDNGALDSESAFETWAGAKQELLEYGAKYAVLLEIARELSKIQVPSFDPIDGKPLDLKDRVKILSIAYNQLTFNQDKLSPLMQALGTLFQNG